MCTYLFQLKTTQSKANKQKKEPAGVTKTNKQTKIEKNKWIKNTSNAKITEKDVYLDDFSRYIY